MTTGVYNPETKTYEKCPDSIGSPDVRPTKCLMNDGRMNKAYTTTFEDTSIDKLYCDECFQDVMNNVN